VPSSMPAVVICAVSVGDIDKSWGPEVLGSWGLGVSKFSNPNLPSQEMQIPLCGEVPYSRCDELGDSTVLDRR